MTPYGLSPRQLHGIVLLAKGLTTLEIAERLGVSRIAVDTMCVRINRKMGVQTRTQAAVKWVREQEIATR